MTREEAIAILQSMIPTPCRADGKSTTHTLATIALYMAIKALEQQSNLQPTCNQLATDCISRQSVNKLVDELARAISDETCHIQRCRNYGRIMHDILELPSVEPVRKTGKWEYVQYDGNPKIGNWHCSECRLIVNLGFEGEPYYDYCPSCGANMRG